jgi:hypothetical protein
MQRRTGSGGYFGKRASSRERAHRMKTDPRADSTRRACMHVEQRPAAVLGAVMHLLCSIVPERMNARRSGRWGEPEERAFEEFTGQSRPCRWGLVTTCPVHPA